MRHDPLTEALLGSTGVTNKLVILRHSGMPYANPLPTIQRAPPKPFRPVVTQRREVIDGVPPTPPRLLTPHQRKELMIPGLLWWAQADSVGRDHPSLLPVTEPLAKQFMASATEVLDDIPAEAVVENGRERFDHGFRRKSRLMTEATTVVGEILEPIDQIERGVVMIALDLWLSDLLEQGILELYAGSLFANALAEWNEAIMSDPANRRRFPSLLRPAEHHARGIMQRFRDRGFYLGAE